MSLESSARDLAGFVVMAGGMTLLASFVIPGARELPRSRHAAAAAVAFVAVLGLNEAGLLRTLHEDISDRIGGEFDELSTWLVTLAGAVLVTICGRGLQHLLRLRKQA
jgi:hypothetical protein